MQKKVIYIVVGILVAFLILSVAKDHIIKISVEQGVSVVTGMRLSIKSFQFGIIRSFVDIRGMKLFNPKGFRDRVMLDMPEIYVRYDPVSIFKREFHLYDMKIDLKELVVVKDEEGRLNLNALQVGREKKAQRKPGKFELTKLRIDNLELKADKVIYKDYSKGGSPVVKTYNVGLNERYKNVNNLEALVSLVIARTLMRTTVAQLTGFDIRRLQDTASGAIATAEKITAEAAVAAGATLKKTGKVAGETVKEGTQVLKGATEGLGKALMSP
ncbi:MAG: hypothetical protein WBD04_07290, partial [Candidatus Omnitrophota bacterium]